MGLEMPVVWTDTHRGHRPDGGYWLGVRLPGDEEPERGDALAVGLGEVRMVGPTPHGDAPLHAVHDPAMVAALDRAHAEWVAAGHPVEPGQPQVVPYVWPAGPVVRPAATIRAEIGRFATDTMTLISAGTATAARAAVDAALTAADLVLAGAPAAYAAVRPPGHHAGPAFFGGSCYLNNSAAAAQYLRASGMDSVAVLDLDAHHGNGTQAIFWERPDVWFGSLHVDPAAGWYPHYCGHADEVGEGPGRGANHNRPLAPGTGDEGWLDALADLCDLCAGIDADAVVVSLGVDAAVDDPESPLAVTAEGFRAAGSLIAALGSPTVFVQEGGYHLPTLGPLVRCVLDGFEAGR